MPRSLTWIFFFTLTLLIIGGAHYWIWARLVRDLGLSPGWQRGLGALVALLGVSVPLSLVLARTLEARPLMLILYTWLGMMFWFIVLLGASELVRLGAWLWERSSTEIDPTLLANRRAFLGKALGGAVLFVTAGFTFSGLRSALGRTQVKRVEIKLPKLPKELDGFTIAQLTDVHVGPTIGRSFIEEIVQTTNQIQADAVVITGDLVDGPVSRLGKTVELLGGLKSKHGTFFVTGNHEYYSGADDWCDALTRYGIRVLRNEHVTLRNEAGVGLDLAGVDDLQGRQFPGHGADLKAALKHRNEQNPVVLLAHQPRQIHEAVEHAVDLQLSGHTHGGQIWPWNYFVLLQQPVVAGLHWFEKTALYVSPGTGYWGPPLRLGAPAEVTQIVLRAA